MKATAISFFKRFSRFWVFLLFACLPAAPAAGAGLVVTLELAREVNNYSPPGSYPNYQLLFYDVEPNPSGPASLDGNYLISSPAGDWAESFQFSNGVIANLTEVSANDFSDSNSFRNAVNGSWTVLITNLSSTNLYTFNVNLSAGALPVVNVTFPAPGATILTNNPVFAWQSPPGWTGGNAQANDYNSESGYFQRVVLSTSATNWTSPTNLPDGHNVFTLSYVSSLSPATITVSTPLNNLSQALPGWTLNPFLSTYNVESFTVANHSTGNPGTSPLVAFYTWDDGNLAATDFSGNSNTLSAYYNDSGSVTITNDAKAGAHAVSFNSPGIFSGANYYGDNTNILAALAGSFSVSLWVKTTQVSGNNTDDGIFNNTGFLSGLPWDNISGTNFVLPMSLTGSKLAFVTVGGGGSDRDTLHSFTSVNTGQYVHVVVTRDQETGEKNIYVNGQLDASDFGTTDSLDGSGFFQIGANNGHFFNGELDDLEFYSTVLNTSQVMQLYNNPGTALFTNASSGPALASALNATNLNWTTGGDAPWFVEADTTHDGLAAQSGGITDSQTSWIQTTVPTNGQVSFFWKVSSESNADFLSFYINGVLRNDITGEVDWNHQSYNVSAGDTLRWEYAKDDSVSDGQDAGWLDQVQFTNTSISVGPVSVSLFLQLTHYRDLIAGTDYYSAIPDISSISPAPITINRIESSDGQSYCDVFSGDTSDDSQSGEPFSSLDQMIFACTNQPWKLYINQGDASQEVFTFKISISGLTSNLVGPVNVLVPLANAVNVPTNSPFQWTGPAGMSSVFAEAYQAVPSFVFDGYTSLPGSATNWPSPPGLVYGTNYLYLSFSSNNSPKVTFTTPVDASLNPISSWITEADLYSDTFQSFIVGAPAPLPVQIAAAPSQSSPGNFQLGFQTLAGRQYTIQVRTNIILGNWMNVTNFISDGSTVNLDFPVTNSKSGFYRVIAQ